MKKLFLMVLIFLTLVTTAAVARADTNYNCPSGQTWSSTGNNGAGGCVALPTTATPCAHANAANGGCDLGYTPLEPIPELTSGTDLTSAGSLPKIINAIFVIFITVGALIAVLMLTVGGVQYMISGGPADKNKGIQRAKAALWGILLIAASYLILHTINPQLLNFSLNPCPGGSAGCTVTGNTATNSNTTTNPACGSASSGCSTGYFCGTENGSTSCIPNADQSAQQNCSSDTAGGGQWSYNSWNGGYCWLSAASTKDQCGTGATAGGNWYCPGLGISCYCRK